MALTTILALSLMGWLILLLMPWMAWRCRESLETRTDSFDNSDCLSKITVLMPARNEETVIQSTLKALFTAYPSLKVILIDDNSTDHTAARAQKAAATYPNQFQYVKAAPKPTSWAGKLWALEQGRKLTTTPWLLLLDADISISPGLIESMWQKAMQGYQLVSLLAVPADAGFWNKLLMPAYVFFFKIIYPFHLSNQSATPIAAAAGGIALVAKGALESVDGFASWKNALIDDCTMAKHFKKNGFSIWIGLTHGAKSLRREGFSGLLQMVSRTAYVQLHESIFLLILVTALMGLMFWVPWLGLTQTTVRFDQLLSILSIFIMITIYTPILLYYKRSPIWSLFFSLTATLYLLFTWYSAIRSWAGIRSVWKDRSYQSENE